MRQAVMAGLPKQWYDGGNITVQLGDCYVRCKLIYTCWKPSYRPPCMCWVSLSHKPLTTIRSVGLWYLLHLVKYDSRFLPQIITEPASQMYGRVDRGTGFCCAINVPYSASWY